MEEEKPKLPVEVFMRPVEVLVYKVINTDSNEIMFKDYYYDPCKEVRNKLNTEEGSKLYKVITNFEPVSDIDYYDSDFVDENEDLDDFLEDF